MQRASRPSAQPHHAADPHHHDQNHPRHAFPPSTSSTRLPTIPFPAANKKNHQPQRETLLQSATRLFPSSQRPPFTSTPSTSSSSSSSRPTVAAPTAVLSDIIRWVEKGDYPRALKLYNAQLPALSAITPATDSTHRDLAYTHRMIADCHRALCDYVQTESSLLSAVHHIEESISLLDSSSLDRYQTFIDQQAIHHLLGDTYTALSEAAEKKKDHREACRLALEAELLATKAEQEAHDLLEEESRTADEEAEAKEATLSARVNLALVYTRLMTLSSLPPPSPPLPDPLSSSSHYFKLAKKKLNKAFQTARSFSLHLYQFLCQYHLVQLHVNSGVRGEALVHVREGLQVFVRCRTDGKSRAIEWQEKEWRKEEVGLRIEGAELVMTMEEEKEGEEWERVERVKEGFEWINRVRLQVKGQGEDGVELEGEEKSRVVRVFNALKKKKMEMERGDWRERDGQVSGASPVKRRKVLED